MKRALRPGLGDVPTSGTEQKGASGSEKKKKKTKEVTRLAPFEGNMLFPSDCFHSGFSYLRGWISLGQASELLNA